MKKNMEKDEVKDDILKNEEHNDSIEENKEDIDSSSEKQIDSEIDELKNQLIRLQADFVNYKNRTERERANSIILANESLILKILPVIDNFERAFKHLDPNDENIKGFLLIKEQLIDVLKSEKVEEIISDGEPFDPNYHNAVITEERENVESGIILETFEKGYKINEKVIRPSMVKVSE